MAKAKKTATPRHPIEKEPTPFMSISEVRGEAAYMAMQILLSRVPQTFVKSVMAECYKEADSWGDQRIIEEVDYLFSKVVIVPPCP